MCGVVGFSCDAPQAAHYELLKRIMRESKIRGLHSFGVAYVDDGIKVNKVHDLDELDIPQATRIIFHNRYSTSGDYLDHENNQPLSNKSTALVFNGVLDMRTKDEMEAAYNVTLSCDNDGALLLELCNDDPEEMLQWTKERNASFAGLVLSSSNVLTAFRNANRPLWLATYQGGLYFASTRDIFMRAEPSLDPIELKPDTLYAD
jgi:glucosamine 6-phosphate synthetase-like amidotransferase/phosphosugar isomerase protein|tara:strand:+ start:8268 stop:8879 length:612 start_codon:yes stop_codon:yes gene_type:complete